MAPPSVVDIYLVGLREILPDLVAVVVPVVPCSPVVEEPVPSLIRGGRLLVGFGPGGRPRRFGWAGAVPSSM